MKDDIHPEYHEADVHCGGCGATFKIGSTVKEIRINVCSECHPFYTGKQKLLDTQGRVDLFNRKYGDFLKKEKKGKKGAEEAAEKSE